LLTGDHKTNTCQPVARASPQPTPYNPKPDTRILATRTCCNLIPTAPSPSRAQLFAGAVDSAFSCKSAASPPGQPTAAGFEFGACFDLPTAHAVAPPTEARRRRAPQQPPLSRNNLRPPSEAIPTISHEARTSRLSVKALRSLDLPPRRVARGMTALRRLPA
jgi:hypothetical protein